MVLFALAAHTTPPTFLLALAGLIGTTLAVAEAFRSEDSLGSLFGITGLSRKVMGWSLLGIAGGAGLAILFRYSEGRPLFLNGLEPFVVTAAAIGAAEELLFRGFVQGRLARLGGFVAVLLAAAAHTAYKTALFAFPPEDLVIQYGTLAFWTFTVGAVFGLTRHLSGSVLPALTAHVLFDILVYGDWTRSPWWVWG
jgi:membrane protease YdiL (CAAX protease family)